MTASLKKQLAIWLYIIAFTVFCMIVVGGLTRLTDSGLSIVEWKPISGTLPPLTTEAWDAEFNAYRETPQYQLINKGMTLEEFKGIFWLEYWHRVLGRLIGFLFFFPMMWFFVKHRLPIWVKGRVSGIFALGALQGGIGWFMVKSGLIDVPQVSQYRLGLHLGVAFLILGACIWVAREITHAGEGARHHFPRCAMLAGAGLCALLFVQVELGALVAGLDAGLTFNTFPLMDGRFIPKDLYMMEPWWINHFENITMVQFQHCMGAYLLAVLMPLYVIFTWKDAKEAGIRPALVLLCAVLAAQVVLGVFTLLHVVPVGLAVKHQAVAAVLFALMVWIQFDMRRFMRT